MNLKTGSKHCQMSLQKHSPEILTGIGIAGMIAATVLAVQTTPKALKLLEERKKELEVERLDMKETVKTAWRCYIPTVIVGSLSIFCLIGASTKHSRRTTALTTAYSLSESTLKQYQEKVMRTIGEDKEKDIREAVAKDKLDENHVRNVVISEKGGDTVCYDVISGRYFKSDMDVINKTVNELNRRMRSDMYITLNEFYNALESPDLTEIKIGDDLGWNMDHGYIDLQFSSHLDANGTPCLVMDYRVAPIYEFGG